MDNTWNKPDVFSSKLIKEQFGKEKGVYDYLATHCASHAYQFSVKATCWHNSAKAEIALGRDPDELPGRTHPTCPFLCLRPVMPLSQFVSRNFMANPDKDDSDTSENAPFLPYSHAQSAIDGGKANAGNTVVPSLTKLPAKAKWAISPVNTKGVL